MDDVKWNMVVVDAVLFHDGLAQSVMAVSFDVGGWLIAQFEDGTVSAYPRENLDRVFINANEETKEEWNKARDKPPALHPAEQPDRQFEGALKCPSCEEEMNELYDQSVHRAQCPACGYLDPA